MDARIAVGSVCWSSLWMEHSRWLANTASPHLPACHATDGSGMRGGMDVPDVRVARCALLPGHPYHTFPSVALHLCRGGPRPTCHGTGGGLDGQCKYPMVLCLLSQAAPCCVTRSIGVPLLQVSHMHASLVLPPPFRFLGGPLINPLT